MMRYFVIFIFISAQYGLGQTVWKADIPVVEESDYYNVELSQELIGAGLHYLKIFDEQHNEMPYFIRSANPIQEINDFVEINPGRFVQEDGDNYTYIRFPDVQHTYCISKVEFGIKSKPDYYRQVVLSDSISYIKEYFSLSSRKENVFFTDNFYFSPQTYITIENQHNPSLVVHSIKIYGLCRYVCIYLEAGRKYSFVSDSRDPVSGKYDIEHFRDKIPADLSVLQVKNLHDVVIQEEITPERKRSLIEQPLFLWSVIIVVGAFLVFICVRMIAEMKKKQS